MNSTPDGPRAGDRLGTLSAINVYPIKSTKGTALEHGVVTATGLEHDREWMIVDDDARFVSQREAPRLCLVQPTIGASELTITAPGMQEVRLPLGDANGVSRRVSVWGDEVEAEMAPRHVSEWLSDFLGARHHLARIPPRTVRAVDPEFGRRGDRVGFADAFPFLIISQAALDDLNERLIAQGLEALPMNRFRPNLVVTDCEPFAEDGWQRMSIGPIDFRVVKPCARCVITTTDQATGAVGREPLRTLASYRKVGSKVLFGQNACHDQVGVLSVGDLIVSR